MSNAVRGRSLRTHIAIGVLAMLLGVLAIGSSAHAAPPPAVDPHITDGSAQHDLAVATARWHVLGGPDYHYSVERLCFCTPSYRGPSQIVVRGGQPLGAAQAFSDVATVPRLFAIVQQAIDDEVASLTVRYDVRGVPVSIDIDRNRLIIDEEMSYRVRDFALDRPYAAARGDVYVSLRWRGPGGDADRQLRCRDGLLTSAWPDADVCLRILSTPELSRAIGFETRDRRVTPDPTLFTAFGYIEGRYVAFSWTGQGSSTRLARLRAWETALGPAAIATVRNP